MREHGIEPIDLLAVNLYPFAATVARPDCTYEDAVENIDIGGPAMVRAAAKNHASVTVVVDPGDYRGLLDELAANQGATDIAMRQKLAAKAFAHTAQYDAMVSAYFTGAIGSAVADVPGRSEPVLSQALSILRYGENPHQQAAFYADPRAIGASVDPSAATARQGTVVQQHRRQRHGARVRAPVRRAGMRDRQARQPLRRRARRHDRGGLRAAPTAPIRPPRSAASSPFNRELDAADRARDRRAAIRRGDSGAERRGRRAAAAGGQGQRARARSRRPWRCRSTQLLEYKSVAGGLLVQTRDRRSGARRRTCARSRGARRRRRNSTICSSPGASRNMSNPMPSSASRTKRPSASAPAK